MHRVMPVRRAAAALVLLLAISACTASQAFVASGESLATLGAAFGSTGQLMDQALDAKTVTPEQYREWAAFARRFKLVYLPACDLWLAAAAAKDDRAAAKAAAVLAALSVGLAEFSKLVLKEGGAP